MKTTSNYEELTLARSEDLLEILELEKIEENLFLGQNEDRHFGHAGNG